MANRYQEDLRRIVGIDDLAAGISPQAAKQPIGGTRGIVYFDAKGNSQATSGKPPTTDRKTGATDGGTLPPGGDEANDGSAGGSGGSSGGNSVGDAGLTNPYNPDDGSGLAPPGDFNMGGSYTGMTGTFDCDSGQAMDVRFDGEFAKPEGYSEATGEKIAEGTVFVSALSAAGATVESGGTVIITGGSGTWSAWAPDDPSYTQLSYPTGLRVDGNKIYIQDDPYDDNSGGLTVDYVVIDSSQPGENYWYNPDNNTTLWPDDGPLQLSFNPETRQYETHPDDPNVPTKYAEPVNEVEVCDALGQKWREVPGAEPNTRVLLSETDALFKVVGPNGNVTAAGDLSKSGPYRADGANGY